METCRVDASVAALLGAGLGVLGTVLAAAVNSRTSARSQEQLLASEAEHLSAQGAKALLGQLAKLAA